MTILLLSWCFVFVLSPHVFATVSLSEFQIEPSSDQWVEIYNDASESATILNWVIDDSGGSEKFTVGQAELTGFTYQVFHSGKFNLNKTEDVLRFFDSNGNLVESFSYGSNPGENISWGKTNNGDWGICSPTPGGENNCLLPSSTPTPTLTPSPSPVPTATPKPSATFTFTPSPKATLAPTKTITTQQSASVTTSLPTIALTTVDKVNIRDDELTEESDLISTPDGEVLSVSTSTAETKKTQKDIQKKDQSQDSRKVISLIFIFIGSLLIAGSAILFYTAKRNEGNN